MALFLQFISVVIPIHIIEEKCKAIGGLKGVLNLNKEWVGRKILYDDYLYKDGAMSPDDIQPILDFWKTQGFTLTETKQEKTYWKDLCVVDMLEGPTLPCEWLEYDKETHIARMKGKS